MNLGRILVAGVLGLFFLSVLIRWTPPSPAPEYESLPIGTHVEGKFEYDDYEPCTFSLSHMDGNTSSTVVERFKLGEGGCGRLEDGGFYSIKGTVVGREWFEDAFAREMRQRNPAMYYSQQLYRMSGYIPVVEGRPEPLEWPEWALDNFSWIGSPAVMRLLCSEKMEYREVEITDVLLMPERPKRVETFAFVLNNDSAQDIALLDYGIGWQSGFKFLIFRLGAMPYGAEGSWAAVTSSNGDRYECDLGGEEVLEYVSCIVPEGVGFENVTLHIAIDYGYPPVLCEGETAVRPH